MEKDMNNELSSADTPADFASTLDALEATVRRLEGGQLGLEDSVALFKQGMDLAKRAESQLLQARQTVEILLGENATSMTQDE
jgi:exodeoxyribonuclease VII small subunit